MGQESQEQAARETETAELPHTVQIVKQLPEQLGLVETEELGLLRGQVVEAMTSGTEEDVKELATRYHELGQEVVNQLQGPDFARGQLGLMIAMANIRRDANRWETCVEDLEEALDYCYQMSLEGVAPSILLALSHDRQQLEKQRAPATEEYERPPAQG